MRRNESSGPRTPRRLWRARIAAATLAALGSCSGGDDDAPEAQMPNDLIQAERFSALVFEIDAVQGAAPSRGVRDRVGVEVALLVDKPDGVTVVQDETLPPSEPDHAWTKEELHELAERTENLPRAGGQARVHVVAVDGHSVNDRDGLVTLGLSFGGRTIVLFEQTLHSMCAAGQLKTATVSQFCEECETLIWLHEFGHLLGLVNNGTPMVEDHQDVEHGGHDQNPECIMHWLFHHVGAVEKLRGRFNAGNVAPLGFDQQCLDDLRAARSPN